MICWRCGCACPGAPDDPRERVLRREDEGVLFGTLSGGEEEERERGCRRISRSSFLRSSTLMVRGGCGLESIMESTEEADEVRARCRFWWKRSKESPNLGGVSREVSAREVSAREMSSARELSASTEEEGVSWEDEGVGEGEGGGIEVGCEGG